MRRIGSVAALAAVVALPLVAGCTDEGSGGGRGRPDRTDDVGPAVPITTPPTSAPETTPATTERPRPSGPTTTLDPESQAVADFVELFAAGDLRALTLLEPLSPAYVWVQGELLLGSGTASDVDDLDEGAWRVEFGNVALELDRFRVKKGLISNFSRQGEPLTKTVFGSGATFEGTGAGAGITGTVHSIRYLDGSLEVIVTTKNEGLVPGRLVLDAYRRDGVRYVPEGRPTPVAPGDTATSLVVFDDVAAPGDGGTLVGRVLARRRTVAPVRLPVPEFDARRSR